MSPVLGKKTLREIRRELDFIPHEQPGLLVRTRLISEIDAALSPKRSVQAAKVRRVAKHSSRNREWREVRTAVLKRAWGRCESCGETEALECDHMFGGGGRRKSLESIFTVWALCLDCHLKKTRNEPSAAAWLRAFVTHCTRREAEAMGDAGYFHAASIAQARLDSLSLQGRAGGAP